MGARKINRSPLRAVPLAGLTLVAVVTACDSEAPTAIDDALLDVLANPDAAINADGSDNPVSGGIQIRGTPGVQPLIFVDGVELEAGSAALSSLNPDDIDRIEVIKGEAAADLYGERAENGVIQIFTIESDATEHAEPSANDAPPPGGDDEQTSVTWTVRDGSFPRLEPSEGSVRTFLIVEGTLPKISSFPR